MSEMDYDSADEEVWDNSDDDVEMTQEDEGSSASEEEYMDDYNDDFKVVSSKGKRKSYEIEAEALPVEAIEETINKDVEHVVGIFGIDTSTALILLRHMNWNKERLIEKYMDNPNALDTAAGISLPPPLPTAASASRSSGIRRITRRSASLASPTSKVSEPFTCPVCYDTSPPSTSSLQCGHQFCDDCWGMYLHAKIRDEGECTIGCMASDCSIVAPDTFIERACDKETFARFKELIARHFVAHTSHLKFCPYPSCTYTISCPSAATKSSLLSMVPTVHCTEGHTFCFGCNHEGDHRPLICAVVKLWLKKCQDDSETANWIKSNTKECSKCQSTIEKNGGCNHMTCKKCKYEFCWVCMGPWSEHGTQWYNCNRFEEQSGVEARDQQSKSRASLERYLHYYNRWANHEQSIRLSKDLYAKTEKKMEEMQITSNLTWIEVQFARKAVDEVERCRTTLKWTYAMAYYLEKSNEKELFEDNQRDLEKAVEDLSELLESPIEPDHIATLRQKMTDKTVYVQKRNEIMLEDTANGFQEGRWEWNVSIE